MNIYSKVTPGLLLHVINRYSDIKTVRNDISPDKEYLQVSCFETNKDMKYKSHKHLPLHRKTDITQESWVVIDGEIQVTLYDIDDAIIHKTILKRGDCTVTFGGGHGYECLKNNTKVYEFKTGPYYGQTKDKVLIDQ